MGGGGGWGVGDIRFLLCACGRGTSVGVIAPGIMLPILVIGLLNYVGGPLGCSDWLGRLSWWAWLAGQRMSMQGTVVVCPGVVKILLFYAPVCCLAVCCAAEISSWLLFGGTDCIWLAGCGLFFRQVSVTLVMATDSAAVAGGRAGITFGVELVVPWDAPEPVVDLHSDNVMDLETVPDVLGLSVRALVPDTRVLERGFYDVTIVDMGDLPESSVSMDELSLLRRQWPPTVLRHMVWLQQDLDTMCAEAKNVSIIPGRGIVPPVKNGLNATCIAM